MKWTLHLVLTFITLSLDWISLSDKYKGQKKDASEIGFTQISYFTNLQ